MYDELNQIIVSIAVARPKAGVFITDIPYLLVICTTVEIIVLAMKFDQNNVYSRVQLYPTEYTIASDNVQMLQVIGTPNGRIFLGGNDSHVYELVYSSSEGWFGGSCF